MEYATSGGHLHVLRWLCEDHARDAAPTAMVKAARNGHLHVLEYLGDRFPAVFERIGAKMVHTMIVNAHVDFMTGLISMLPMKALKCKEGGTTNSCDRVRPGRHSPVVQRARDRLPMDVQTGVHGRSHRRGRGNGHIAVLQFLTDQEKVEIDSDDDKIKALAVVVLGGHRECVVWLLEHSQQCFTAPNVSTTVWVAQTEATATRCSSRSILIDNVLFRKS
jgi:hypothetical protein